MPHPLLRQRYAGTNKDDNALGRSENGAIPSKHRNKTFNKTFILGNIHPQEQGLNGSFLVAELVMTYKKGSNRNKKSAASFVHPQGFEPWTH